MCQFIANLDDFLEDRMAGEYIVRRQVESYSCFKEAAGRSCKEPGLVLNHQPFIHNCSCINSFFRKLSKVEFNKFNSC